jgi:hypothetical protein
MLHAQILLTTSTIISLRSATLVVVVLSRYVMVVLDVAISVLSFALFSSSFHCSSFLNMVSLLVSAVCSARHASPRCCQARRAYNYNQEQHHHKKLLHFRCVLCIPNRG